MTSLEYGQKTHAIDETCVSGIEQCSRTARRLLSALVVGVMTLAMTDLLCARLLSEQYEGISVLLKIGIGVYAILLLIKFSFVQRSLYFVKRRYHKDMKELYRLYLADAAARADGAVILPREIERYDHAVIDWRSAVTVPVTLLLCALLILPYYYVDTHTTFTPKGWVQYSMRWRPHMVRDLVGQQSESCGWTGQFNLYPKTREEIKEMFYQEEYADVPVDFSAVCSDGKHMPEYDAYYLYTDGDGKNHWLVVNYRNEKERILFSCTGDVCRIPY